MKTHSQRGFTLLELLLALTIVTLLLLVAFTGLRVGLGAWRRGEDRAAGMEHARGLPQALSRALGAIYPYQAPRAQAEQVVVIFEGESDRLGFVTTAPPVPTPIPVAFTAVQLSMVGGETPGLAIRQKVLPNWDPFADTPPVLVDPSVTAVRFRYSEAGNWQDTWQPSKDHPMPDTLEVTITTRVGHRTVEQPPLTVPIRVPSP